MRWGGVGVSRPRRALVALLLLLAAVPRAHAETRPLRWGGDEEGGAPYIYRDDDGSGRLIGFEVELIDSLAVAIGRRAEFQQCQWDELLKLLAAGGVDVVVNGYELTTERLAACIATIPYFLYELHLFARTAGSRLATWDDLERARPGGGRWRIGVLTATVADDYLTRTFAEHVEVVRYDGTVQPFRDVETGTLDATLTDTPSAGVYGSQFPVRQVGAPRERGYYVMYLRPGNERLRDALDSALRDAMRDGALERILARYSLWSPAQDALTTPEVQSLRDTLQPRGPGSSGWAIVRRDLPLLLRAAGMTVVLSLIAMPIAIVLGLAIALGRLHGPAALRPLLATYVEALRGTPLLLQLLFVYYGLVPVLGLPDAMRGMAAFIAAVTGLAVNYSAYEAEIYRAGLLAIPVGQTEAALAIGLSRRQALRHVVVPQAVRLVVPPVTNDFINLFKDTSICSVITVVELSKQYNILVNNTPRAFAELALVTSFLYLAMSYPLAVFARRLERRRALARA
jgi:polar amino acid transport system substrate-binding protein